MGNQQAISEKRFNGLRWKQGDGVFTANVDVHQSRFGYFTVAFEFDIKNEKVYVEIECLNYKELWMKKTAYDTFAGALEGANSFFQEINELESKLSISALDSAMFAYKTVLRNEIKRIKEST